MARTSNALKREVNFFDALERHEAANKKRDKSPKAAIAVLAGLAAVLGVGYGVWMNRQIREKEQAIQLMQQYVEDPANQEAYERQAQLRDDSSQLRAYNEACEQYIAIIEAIPRLGSVNFSDIYQLAPENVRVVSYSYAYPILTVSCDTADKDAPARFAESLSESGIFKGVGYDGFISLNEENGTYSFSIQCQLW